MGRISSTPTAIIQAIVTIHALLASKASRTAGNRHQIGNEKCDVKRAHVRNFVYWPTSAIGIGRKHVNVPATDRNGRYSDVITTCMSQQR